MDFQAPSGRLSSILQVPLGMEESTSVFEGISHGNLCSAFQYWVDQVKMLLGEPVEVKITQSLRDDGIDIIVELLQTEQKIGIQVKNWRDINSSDFTSKVMSQISYSRKHGAKELYVALCGDLMSPSQAEKIRGLISNISEMKDNYVKVISPEKAITIYQCYIKKQHPITLIKGSKEITQLLLGLAKSLSDEYFSASVSLKFEAKEIPSPETHPFKLDLKLKGTEKERPLKSVDLIRRAIYLREEVTLPAEEIEDLIIQRGKEVVHRGRPQKLVIKPEKKFLPPVIFQVIDEKGRPGSSLENIIFERYVSPDKKVTLVTSDDNLPAKIVLTMDSQSMKAKMKYDFDIASSDVEQFLGFYRFMAALKATKTVQILKQEDRSVLTIGRIPDVQFEAEDEGYMRIIEDLSLIQRKTGTRIPVPIRIEASDAETIINTARLLKDGEHALAHISFTSDTSKIGATTLLNELKRKGKVENMVLRLKPLIANILGNRVIVGDVRVEVPEAVPTRSLNDLEKDIELVHEDGKVSIDLKSAGTEKPTMHLEGE